MDSYLTAAQTGIYNFYSEQIDFDYICDVQIFGVDGRLIMTTQSMDCFFYLKLTQDQKCYIAIKGFYADFNFFVKQLDLFVIGLNETLSNSVSHPSEILYKFTAETNGEYNFVCVGENTTQWLKLYDDNFVFANEKSGKDIGEVSFTVQMEAGETYYLCVRSNSSDITLDFSLTVTIAV